MCAINKATIIACKVFTEKCKSRAAASFIYYILFKIKLVFRTWLMFYSKTSQYIQKPARPVQNRSGSNPM